MGKTDTIIEVLNHLKTSIFVTDLETDEILFMNQWMKTVFQVEHPEGELCYKVLQKYKETPCEFCPKKKLKQSDDKERYIIWKEHNIKLHKDFENYDCLITWIDGRKVHLQQCMDITDSIELNKMASLDDLCQIYNRRAGKELLRQYLNKAKQKKENVQVILLDVDNLKIVNDQYGHREGDFLLKTMTSVLKQQFKEPDFIFRLGGDEFVIVSITMDEKQIAHFMYNELQHVKQLKEEYHKDYDISYCYGIYTVTWDDVLEIDDIIAKADDIMYKQKLRIHKNKMAERENPFRHEKEKYNEFHFNTDQLYDALLNSTDDFIYVCDMKSGIFRYSPAQVKLFGLPQEIIENPLPLWKEIVHPQDWERFYKSNMQIGENQMDYHSVEFRAKTVKNEYIWLKCRGQLMRDEYGEPSIFAGIMTQLDRQNKIDPLTHLLNRHEFNKAGTQKLKDRAIDNLGVVIIDIDDFKNVNELYDRSFGDMVLKTTSQLIQSNLPGNASLYKLDNDQLGVLIENTEVNEIQIMYQLLQRQLLHQQLQERFKCAIQISAGCAISTSKQQDFQELYTYADYALQMAKSKGKNRLCFFEQKILENKLRSLDILRSLRECIAENYKGFSVAYQPQIETSSGRMKGVEALMRWNGGSLGFVPPMEFIPIMEENGMIENMGLWILDQAMQACKKWMKIDPDFSVSVNVSALQILNGDFQEKVKQMMHVQVFPSKNMILELTESNTVGNMQIIQDLFDDLRRQGVRLAMDDFGTGYSTLENLKKGVTDIVKIDRAFVKDIQKSEFDVLFIQFIIAICHCVNIQVCLEGIETVEELDFVSDLELDYYQGYLFGKPVSEEEITKRLLEEKTMEE